MSCGIALAAALLASQPAASVAVPAAAAQNPLTAEPMYAGIVARAQALSTAAAAWRTPELKARAAAATPPGWTAFAEQASALAELDMRAHRDLAARGFDGDLKCILKGIAEDIPLKLEAVAAARTGAAQDLALSELLHLLDDNAAVVAAPPAPPA
ncbi:MAG TPA: hypothetical protein VD929_05315 [Caulobacteraceae bacterium]|nr:hypothetical protein [Caulobacteraceae bacterium]